MNVLVIFAMVEIHADWKTAIPVEREVNQLILGLKDNTFADFNPLLKLSLMNLVLNQNGTFQLIEFSIFFIISLVINVLKLEGKIIHNHLLESNV